MKHFLMSLFVLAAFPLMSLVPAFAAYNMQDYYPLSQGNSWTYFSYEMETENGETEIYAGTDTEIVSGTDNVGGVSTIRLIEVPHDPQDYDYQNIAWDEKGLTLYYDYEGKQPEFGGTDLDNEEGRFLTPAVILPAQMEIGQIVSYNFAVEWYEDGELEEYEEGTTTYTLEKIETITVEAGTFQDCLKIHKEFSGIVYDRKDGTKKESWAENGYVWLARGIGPIKEINTDTTMIIDENVEELDTESRELRWANINNIDIGTGVRLWYGIDFSNAEASFNETTMYLRDIYVGHGEYCGLAFRLDLEDNIFYAFEPAGCGPVSISGLDFANAYIKMNGDSLTIYDIDILGTKYWTQWRLVIEPSVGFLCVNGGFMQ
jgi:hypothetical protein